MPSDFKIHVQGPDAQKVAAGLSDLIEKQLGERPDQEAQGTARTDVKSIDPVALAAVILSVPATLLTVRDLLSRAKKKKDVDGFIRQAIEYHSQNPDSEIRITLPDGSSVNLQKADSTRLLDAANE